MRPSILRPGLWPTCAPLRGARTASTPYDYVLSAGLVLVAALPAVALLGVILGAAEPTALATHP